MASITKIAMIKPKASTSVAKSLRNSAVHRRTRWIKRLGSITEHAPDKKLATKAKIINMKKPGKMVK